MVQHLAWQFREGTEALPAAPGSNGVHSAESLSRSRQYPTEELKVFMVQNDSTCDCLAFKHEPLI